MPILQKPTKKELSQRNKRKKPLRNLPKEKKDKIHRTSRTSLLLLLLLFSCLPLSLSVSVTVSRLLSVSVFRFFRFALFAFLSLIPNHHTPPRPSCPSLVPRPSSGGSAPRPSRPPARSSPDARSCVFILRSSRRPLVSDLFSLQYADVIHLLLFPMIAARHGEHLCGSRRLEICVVPSA